jgi:sec-independent protein translocase protein TatA
MPSGWEWIVVLVIAVALFGSRLPKIARNLGQAQQEFKKGQSQGSQGNQSAPQADQQGGGSTPPSA